MQCCSGHSGQKGCAYFIHRNTFLNLRLRAVQTFATLYSETDRNREKPSETERNREKQRVTERNREKQRVADNEQQLEGRDGLTWETGTDNRKSEVYCHRGRGTALVCLWGYHIYKQRQQR